MSPPEFRPEGAASPARPAFEESSRAYGYLDILEANQDSAWILRVDGVVEHANQKALALFGAPGARVDWRALWPEESRFSLDRSFNSATEGAVARFRAFLGGAAKARIYCDTTIAPVRDAEGRIVRLLATARDVTEEVETQGFLRTVLQLLPLPLTVRNVEDRRYVLINRAAEDALGLVADETIGRTIDQVLPADRAARTHAIEAAVLRSGEMQVLEEAIEIGGETRHLLIKTLATYDDIGARHVVTLGEDVTARRRSAEALRSALDHAEQASQAKSAFLANMSHEIRTPLNGIIAGADLLSKTLTEPRARELVEMIAASGHSLEGLLSDVLDLVRIEAGHMVIEAAPFELGDMARSVAALCALRADEKGVRLDVTVSDAAERTVTGDGARLRQVLTNLLNNAVKFTDRGEVALRVTVDDQGRTRFEVIDTGIGFDAVMKARICERFQQADASFTRRFGGTGLGLAISRELVQLMGGELDCDSAPGVGSTFWFALPLVASARTPAPVEDTVEAPAGAPRVLVADDHPTNRKVVELMLAEVADIVTAQNGLEAVEMYGLAPPDLVLMDMQMPVMDGLEAVRRIRALETARGAARVPIIMLTANARPEHVRASREAGADVHLQKPITSAALFAAIGEAMDVRTDDAQDATLSA
ncbi:PAS domain-containing hybrid sensor histidine kinase/response regulator [Caulobacter sp. RL271]|uniref:histidine kinase n=1 Tax=Caulobacter segnis TaxID=88688 RepID=A0ABY4ZV98_9CAUL|nr:ATP-binding protein [Caulobacter segnis]USQ96544.1 ATP-binding protein [Caulobacter segnis]